MLSLGEGDVASARYEERAEQDECDDADPDENGLDAVRLHVGPAPWVIRTLTPAALLTALNTRYL